MPGELGIYISFSSPSSTLTVDLMYELEDVAGTDPELTEYGLMRVDGFTLVWGSMVLLRVASAWAAFLFSKLSVNYDANSSLDIF